MKSKIPIEWERLNKKQKNDIVEYCKRIVVNQYEEEMQNMMTIMIEMSMIVLHDYLNFDKDQLLIFMAMFRMRFPKEAEFVKDGKQEQEHQRLLQEWLGDGKIVENFIKLIMDKPGETEFK